MNPVRLLLVLIILPCFKCLAQSGYQPYRPSLPRFVGPVRNVTVALGKEAVLQCAVENLGDHKVSVQQSTDRLSSEAS